MARARAQEEGSGDVVVKARSKRKVGAEDAGTAVIAGAAMAVVVATVGLAFAVARCHAMAVGGVCAGGAQRTSSSMTASSNPCS